MNRLIFILTLILAILGCSNETENKTTLTPSQMNDSNKKETRTNNSEEKFFIKLNTIYGENGLEDYSTDAQEVFGEIIKQLKGSDGSEYYLLKLNEILNFTDKNDKVPMKTKYLIIGGRFRERPLKKGAIKTVVNVAIVKDESLINDELLDFSKAIFAGYGEATEVKQ